MSDVQVVGRGRGKPALVRLGGDRDLFLGRRRRWDLVILQEPRQRRGLLPRRPVDALDSRRRLALFLLHRIRAFHRVSLPFG